MTPTPTHPTPNGPHCEEFQMSDNMCISCSPAVNTLYCSASILRPRGFGSFHSFHHFLHKAKEQVYAITQISSDNSTIQPAVALVWGIDSIKNDVNG